MLSTHSRSRLIGWIDQITGLGLKIGVPLLIVSAGYLLFAAFGRHIAQLGSMKPEEKAYFEQSLALALNVATVTSAVSMVSVVIRIFNDEILGQVLSLLGAALYFGSPAFFAFFGSSQVMRNPDSAHALASIVQEFRVIGAIFLLPGLCLVLRDAILRIWTGISVRRIAECRWGDEEERHGRHTNPKFYGSCWDTPFCRDFVRRVCPAWNKRTPCWRIKVGCYCDEATILRAMTSMGTDNEHVRGIMQSLGLDKQARSKFSSKQKRARCRRCGIYAEHQRQKYRLLSPLVFPAVGLVLYAFYGQIAVHVAKVLEATDRFMSFLTYRGPHYSFAADEQTLTTLAMVWLTIVAVSYALRALEYLIFELQV